MDFDYLKLALTVALAVIGWIVAHRVTADRDRKNKRREISLEHLVNAYRILTNEVTHRDLNTKRTESLENILSDIQLFGSLDQVELAKELAVQVAEGRGFELDPLINSLRDDLRFQLQLEVVVGNVKWLRFNSDCSDSDNEAEQVVPAKSDRAGG